MISQTAVVEKAGMAESSPSDLGPRSPGLLALLALSTWCGLVTGLLEVGTIVVHKRFFDANQLYGLSRHFVWLIPITNLVLFVMLGACGCVVSWAWPRRGWWVFVRTLFAFALTLLPVVLIAFPRVYGLAWLFVAFGVAARAVPMMRRHATTFRRLVGISFPLLVGTVAALAALPWLNDRVTRSRESERQIAAGWNAKCTSRRDGYGRGRSS